MKGIESRTTVWRVFFFFFFCNFSLILFFFILDFSNFQIYFVGPDAGEVVQGYAVAMRCGATYKDFHDTVGIHPTVSEKICDLSVTKSSGGSADSSGC